MQLEELTEEVFTQHLRSKFSLQLEQRTVELELVSVSGDKSGLEKIAGTERFSVYFLGPGDFYLPQRIYHLEHAVLGELDIFIVPIGVVENQLHYEAIFSRMTQ